ncbi:MAG: sulfotransferase family 2 domain-containing protein [Congregibacter sp.]
MIVSHEHKFIFLHCRKVAGSSVKTAIYPCLGSRDVMVGSVHEAINNGCSLNSGTRRALLSPIGLARFLACRVRGYSVPDCINEAIKARYKGPLGSNPPHATAAVVKAFVGEQIWNSYYKFCFVRNPFEQVISDYFWRRTNRKRGAFTFDQFLDSLEVNGKDGFASAVRNWDILTINGEPAVDYIGRYEDLETDFAHACGAAGLPVLSLGKEKRGQSNFAKPTFELNGDQTRRLQKIFVEELEYFDYGLPDKIYSSDENDDGRLLK